MSYAHGFIAAVPQANRDVYRRHAKKVGEVFRENGASQVMECWEEEVPDGEVTSFPLAVRRKEGEAVVFSWYRWPSKEVADAGMKATMADERVRCEAGQVGKIFDGKRIIYGGFDVVAEKRADAGIDTPYVHGMAAAVVASRREAYAKCAGEMGAILRERGALEVVDCWEEAVPEGELTSFPKAVLREEGEAVVFSWILWPSKEAGRAGMGAMREDARLANLFEEIGGMMNLKRLIHGGFTPLVAV